MPGRWSRAAGSSFLCRAGLSRLTGPRALRTECEDTAAPGLGVRTAVPRRPFTVGLPRGLHGPPSVAQLFPPLAPVQCVHRCGQWSALGVFSKLPCASSSSEVPRLLLGAAGRRSLLPQTSRVAGRSLLGRWPEPVPSHLLLLCSDPMALPQLSEGPSHGTRDSTAVPGEPGASRHRRHPRPFRSSVPLDHVASLMFPMAVSSPHLGSSDSHKHQEPLYSAWCETRTLWSLPLLNLLAHLCNGGTSKHSLLLRPQDS